MSASISWSADGTSTTIQSFKVYRAFTGTISGVGPFSVIGKYLKVQTAISSLPFVHKFGSNNLSDLRSELNSIPGIHAEINNTNDQLIVRSTDGFLKIFPTEGALDLGLLPATYVPQRDFALIGTVPFISATDNYSFTDLNGKAGSDYYHLTILNTSNEESLPSVAFKADENFINICSLEGSLVNFPGGGAMPNQVVRCKPFLGPAEHCNYAVADVIAETYTDSYGRWRLNVPRNCLVYLEIPAAGYSKVFQVPNLAAFFFSQFQSDAYWRFNNDFTGVFGGI